MLKKNNPLILRLAPLAVSLGLLLLLEGHSPVAAREQARRTPNLLISEKSPYLLQHAYNPVDWHPWGEGAFEKARRLGRPIFLSVGYSTCHWCHVMERESFSDRKIAAIMNEHFISIKVDREERPDVDEVYMTFVQATTGHGGWPMSVFLTPQLEPFFGGTYFPPQARGGRTGFKELLLEITKQWKNRRQAIVRSAGKLTEALKNRQGTSADENLKLDQTLLEQTYRWYSSSYDTREAGFGPAPKFPRSVNFNFLLRYHARTGQEKALEMTTHTLRKMALGGMHDHLGGGFHRYSTDDRWHLPHFEKMLYDQAQLAISYLEAFQITGDGFFADVARDIFHYVLRDMTDKEGGFYSAEDADSPLSHEEPEKHSEGAFYVWTWKELAEILGEQDAPLLHYYYGVEKNGNVERDPFGEFTSKNILHVSATVAQSAQKFGKSQQEVEEVLRRARRKLFKVRETKPRPPLDDKVITAWNGLMISALARGYQVLREKRYLEAAERAAFFLAERLYDEKSDLLYRRYRAGDVGIEAFLDDYVFFSQGLLDLYETSLDGRWLTLAMQLTKKQDQLFWDAARGGFFNTTTKDPSILLRMKEDYDGALPSPNSIAVLNLLRLSQMTGSEPLRKRATKSIRAFGKRVVAAPQAMPQMMVAVNFYLDKPKQIFIAGERNAPDTRALLAEVHKRFLPNRIILLADGGPAQHRLAESLEVLNTFRRIDGKATAYICENYACRLPTNQAAVVARLLDGK